MALRPVLQSSSLVLVLIVVLSLVSGRVTGGAADVPMGTPVTLSEVVVTAEAPAEAGSVWLREAVVVAEAPMGTPVTLPEVVVTAEAPVVLAAVADR